jgi:anaerobic selenocysteine-containing dehydrogenase
MGSTDILRVRTMCPMNCHPTLCGMIAEVRDGQLVTVRGDEGNPDSRGFLCVRGQASREVIGNPERLLYPMMRRRRGDAFERVGWDAALDRIAGSIRATPGESTAFWAGHGTFTTNYGTRFNSQLMARFAHFVSGQFWNPTIVCWGLGAFGLALTGPLETNTKQDMAEHTDMILLWGANFASQPTTAPHVMAAKQRGARVVAIDVRRTEAADRADEVFLVRPGGDAALALAMLHVICGERRYDAPFVAAHTVGFDALCEHVRAFTPAWAEERTGIAAERIAGLARAYASTRPAMIVLGGSSMHKGAGGWEASRAIACLPALTGNLGNAGGGFGPRHGSVSHGRGWGNVAAAERRRPGTAIPNQMSAVTDALRAGRISTLLLMGSNMLSSFADANAVAQGLDRTSLVVSYDLFLNDTSRRFADIVLPSTAWLEELGCKASATHLVLMEPALAPPGETRTVYQLLTGLAEAAGLDGYNPWSSVDDVIDAVLDHPSTGRATVAQLRAEGGIRTLHVSSIAHPALEFDTPSRKIEFVSERAASLGLPALPVAGEPAAAEGSLRLTHGRTLGHFHAFYDSGRALPTLAKREGEPELWLSPGDASARGIADRTAIRVFNARGEMHATARVTDRIPTGVTWMRDGWPGFNTLTAGTPVLPDAAVDAFAFSAWQASFDATVEVVPA